MRLAGGLSGESRPLRAIADAVPRRQGALARTVQDQLVRTVQDKVMPYLLVARRRQEAPRAVPGAGRLGQAQVNHLISLALGGSQAGSRAYVQAMQDGGTPAETLLLDLLSPAARRLGEMWEDDTCTFTDVTIGLQRLGDVMRLLGQASGNVIARPAAASVLLVQMPGEQHGFGLAMVAQFFRRAGWSTRQEPVISSAGLADLVAAHVFDLVGISVACGDRLEALAADIRAIRRRSRNPALGVMVGGPLFVAQPQLAAMVDADATAVDGRQAVREAQSLVGLRAGAR